MLAFVLVLKNRQLICVRSDWVKDGTIGASTIVFYSPNVFDEPNFELEPEYFYKPNAVGCHECRVLKAFDTIEEGENFIRMRPRRIQFNMAKNTVPEIVKYIEVSDDEEEMPGAQPDGSINDDHTTDKRGDDNEHSQSKSQELDENRSPNVVEDEAIGSAGSNGLGLVDDNQTTNKRGDDNEHSQSKSQELVENCSPNVVAGSKKGIFEHHVQTPTAPERTMIRRNYIATPIRKNRMENVMPPASKSMLRMDYSKKN